MALAKTNLFERRLQQRANLFKALAHPVRLQILLHLSQTRKCLTGDLSDIFPLTRTTINQHMNELKSAGLIKGHLREGKIVYCLDPLKIKELNAIISAFSSEMELPDGFCCEYMAEKMGALQEI